LIITIKLSIIEIKRLNDVHTDLKLEEFIDVCGEDLVTELFVVYFGLLEAALGDGAKRVEGNEQETVVLQRRCVRAARPLAKGTVLTRDDIEVLRPAPAEAIPAHEAQLVAGKRLERDLDLGEQIAWSDLA
jgi:sialic acid synthase SpsE